MPKYKGVFKIVGINFLASHLTMIKKIIENKVFNSKAVIVREAIECYLDELIKLYLKNKDEIKLYRNKPYLIIDKKEKDLFAKPKKIINGRIYEYRNEKWNCVGIKYNKE